MACEHKEARWASQSNTKSRHALARARKRLPSYYFELTAPLSQNSSSWGNYVTAFWPFWANSLGPFTNSDWGLQTLSSSPPSHSILLPVSCQRKSRHFVQDRSSLSPAYKTAIQKSSFSTKMSCACQDVCRSSCKLLFSKLLRCWLFTNTLLY